MSKLDTMYAERLAAEKPTREQLFEALVVSDEAAVQAAEASVASQAAVLKSFEAYMVEVRGVLAKYIHAGGVPHLTVTSALNDMKTGLQDSAK